MSRKILINTQERAVSSDINRLQSFAIRDAVEALRYRFLGVVAGAEQPSTADYPATTGTPLLAEILGGLMVRPQGGTFNLLIDAGSLVAIDSTNRTIGADDSPAAYVRSTGATVAILANSSGSVRIDVVECRIDPTPEIVTDNRDIFDTTTGLFTATTITKETNDRLEFRVRQGTPGSGYPAAQAGWLPLCVCRVPSGAANVDTCDFWDVRPLIDDWDLQSKGFASTALTKVDMTLSRYGAADARLTGKIGGRINGRRFAGQIRGGQPGTYDATMLNVGLAAVQDTGTIAEPLTAPIYLYACHPFGLPRWAYYAPSPSARLPMAPCAMIIESATAPDVDGSPQAALALPASTSLSGTVSVGQAMCFGIIWPRKSGFPGQIGDFNHMTVREGKARLHVQGNATLVSTSPSTNVFEWAIDDTTWPRNAKAIEVSITLSFSMPAASAVDGIPSLRLINDAIATDEEVMLTTYYEPATYNGSGGVLNTSLTARFRIERPNDMSAPLKLRMDANTWSAGSYGTAPTITSNPSLSVRAYELY